MKKFETKITIDTDKKRVKITHKIDPDRIYDKKQLKELIEKLE